MRILFMGTPDFAVPSLRALMEAPVSMGIEVVGVITQPDKPKGRGYTLTPPPVKVWATEHSLPVYQPQTLRGEEFATLLAELDPELICVVAYGKILPTGVLDYPKHGCINVHGSLLPKYRGAAPMQRAIIDGESVTGVTIQRMAEGIDTGDMLLKSEITLTDEDNFETVHDRLAAAGAKALLDTVAAMQNGTLVATPQNETLATHAAKIEKEDCILHFSDTVRALHCRIRGLSPIPVALTHTPDGKLLKVLAAAPADLPRPALASNGEIVSLEGGVITVACADGTLSLSRVIPEGKRPMDAADYIRGRNISVGDILG